ncbi:hypothetical protein HYPSUDRAFT_185461 [Hypholoma sublateritium FD-334 SS-4]|uniref:5-formyltetrahydrofolate cyclo-ligase n=1 Tax=Hypholoma sublateritium (strain FD-334 SS-4) TaxID=945553 RepID=A0A0D2P338_HYPSF|nr:hypothetical protein HYPSUDRAFT_185461 [Hypholoma sublateritium FD-334 SS-4]
MAAAAAQALKAQKRALRKTISTALSKLSPEAVSEQSHAIATRVLALPAVQRAGTVSCYMSMPSGEARTLRIAEGVLASAGRRLFVPKIGAGEGAMEFFRVYTVQDMQEMAPGLWGIPEPGETWGVEERERVLASPKEILDVILVPGVAFDRSLARLGHGKGHYDRFITAYVASGRPKPLLVGLALSAQLLPAGQVPVGAHDWKMDVLITPEETLGVGADGEVAAAPAL